MMPVKIPRSVMLLSLCAIFSLLCEINLWCAPSSNPEEPYSLIVLAQTCEAVSLLQSQQHKNFKGGGDYPCPYDNCKKRYKGLKSFEEHINAHANRKPYRCFVCSKSFTRAGSLSNHKRIHTRKGVYICSYQGCGREFTNRGHYIQHHSYSHFIS